MTENQKKPMAHKRMQFKAIKPQKKLSHKALFQTKRSWIRLYLKGIAMGAADAVPGVSGGTIAFISGIYEELILAIRSFDGEAVRLLAGGDVTGFWRHVHGTFLAVLLAGIGSSLLVFSRLILYWLAAFPVLVWAFFMGLIIASVLVVGKKIGQRTPRVFAFGFLGIMAGYSITVAVPAQTPETLGFVFLSGMIAICAMILPGISGSFILVLLSKYEYIFTALRDFNLGVIGVFGCGCAVGLLSFSHLLGWTLRRYHAPTIATLTGLMIGSLNKVWPWKIVVASYITAGGTAKPLVLKNILPGAYLEATGNAPHLAFAVFLAIAGFFMVYFLDKFSAGAPGGGDANERIVR